MKIGVISQPNQKGQVVIPQKYRKALGINEKVPLNIVLRGQTVCISPIKEVLTPIEGESSYYKILEKTKGSWAKDSWPKVRKKRRITELKAAKKRQKPW